MTCKNRAPAPMVIYISMISIDYKKINLDAGGVKSVKMTFLKSKTRSFYNFVITWVEI